LAEALQVSVNQLVLAWLMQGKYKIIPLITSENPAQILENIDAGSIVLPEDQIHYLANISA
jgi:aryl-alcohol dehydrogenase-like predicted oxidoreductase